VRVTTNFQKVAVKGVYRWKDPVTGRPRQRTEEFYQTISPFNNMPDGSPKTYAQIMKEVSAQRDEWLAKQEPTQ
jgi:hypothetical protein